MIAFSTIGLAAAALAVCPKAAEIDFRPLPAANTMPAYKLKVVLTTAAGESLCIPGRFAGSADPEAVADVIAFSLRGTDWKYKQDGVKLTVYGSKKSPVVKVEFETDVEKPIVRWKLLPPEKK